MAAIDALEKAVASQPRFTEAHFKLAEALADAGRADEAVASYTEALRVDPFRHSSAWNNLGFQHLQADRIDEATQALMVEFYRRWNPKNGKGESAATALRKAQEHVRTQKKWRHPYYWAAWVLWGLPD